MITDTNKLIGKNMSELYQKALLELDETLGVAGLSFEDMPEDILTSDSYEIMRDSIVKTILDLAASHYEGCLQQAEKSLQVAPQIIRDDLGTETSIEINGDGVVKSLSRISGGLGWKPEEALK